MVLLFIPLVYIVVGVYGAIALRWPHKTEGTDLLLDVVLWPVMLYFYLTNDR